MDEKKTGRRKLDKPLKKISSTILAEKISWLANLTNPVWELIPDPMEFPALLDFFHCTNEVSNAVLHHNIATSKTKEETNPKMAEIYQKHEDMLLLLKEKWEQYTLAIEKKNQDEVRREYQLEYERYTKVHTSYYKLIYEEVEEKMKSSLLLLKEEGAVEEKLYKEIIEKKIPSLKKSFTKMKTKENKVGETLHKESKKLLKLRLDSLMDDYHN